MSTPNTSTNNPIKNPDKPEIITISIISSHKISAKVTRVISLLSPSISITKSLMEAASVRRGAEKGQINGEGGMGMGPVVVALQAKSALASKAISVAEIVKRKIKDEGEKWYQYTKLSSSTVDVVVNRPSGLSKKKKMVNEGVRETGDTRGRNTKDSVDAGEDEDDPFEELPDTKLTKKNTVTMITIYLSTTPVPELKRLYGEQYGGCNIAGV